MSCIEYTKKNEENLSKSRDKRKFETSKGPLAQVVNQKLANIDECKWVRLNMLNWIDERGRSRQWEVAERTTRVNEIDAVAIVAFIMKEKNVCIL